jgi:trehalose/maltose hydrolase-like predicted phosphorylase
MNNWVIEYDDWNPEQHPLREALLTLGNGYIATRGAMEEMSAGEFNYPGTYLACGYNRAVSKIKDKEIENEDLVNWPNWLLLTFRIGESEWLDLRKMQIKEYIVRLKLKEGILERNMRFRDSEDRETTIISRRFVSMHDIHMAGIEWTIIPENWDEEITVRSGLDGDIKNQGVARYRDLNCNHLDILETGSLNVNSIFLQCQTKQSKIRMVQAGLTRIFDGKRELQCPRATTNTKKSVWQDIKIDCSRLHPLKIRKLVAVFTSKDFAISDPFDEARTRINYLVNFDEVEENHIQAWEQIWSRSKIEIETNNNELLILRLHIFHLHQTVSCSSIGNDVGVPARGWHGEAYRGHIFWDELYIFPYINLHMPQLARSLLMYRYRRLHKARLAARENGYRGAMFPWQSGSNGREESQVIHLNPDSDRWVPDNTRLQRHINAAIPYNVWQYYLSTKDMEFLTSYGAEIIFSTALFWSSTATYNNRRNRYEINGVMGPDEYHTSYPDSDLSGLNNNAYTNFMAAWVLNCALDLISLFDRKLINELAHKSGFSEKDIELWQKITGKMFIPFNEDEIILQFEGFENLKELDWEKYRKKYGNTMRLDRILERENDSVNNYRACKQPDVLMLFYLFSSDMLVKTFKRMGYDFKPGSIPRNIDYYHKITSHGSTLSQVIFSWVYARSDRRNSWVSFESALMSDFRDVQGGTTSEGIHLGAMAGTIDLIQRCYTGLEIRDDVLWLNPRLPSELKEIKLNFNFRGHWIKLKINHKQLWIDFSKGWSGPVEINVQGQRILFEKNDKTEIDLLYE